MLSEPKVNQTKLVAKAHQEYPYLLTYEVPQDNIFGKWFGSKDTVKVLVKDNQKIPTLAQQIKADNKHYTLVKVGVATNRTQIKITDSKKYLNHKINSLQSDLTTKRKVVKILNCYHNS